MTSVALRYSWSTEHSDRPVSYSTNARLSLCIHVVAILRPLCGSLGRAGHDANFRSGRCSGTSSHHSSDRRASHAATNCPASPSVGSQPQES